MALLHDAPEYVVGDLISPFKAAIGINYKALELKLQAAIHLRFGLPAMVPTRPEDPVQEGRSPVGLLRGHPAGRLRGAGGPPAVRQPRPRA